MYIFMCSFIIKRCSTIPVKVISCGTMHSYLNVYPHCLGSRRSGVPKKNLAMWPRYAKVRQS